MTTPPMIPPLIPPTQNVFEFPGTELKKLLLRWPFYIKITGNCSCLNRAKLMDDLGTNWCEKNIDTIVGWLKEEATKRGLPFIEIIARIIIKLAIKRAKKNANIK
jgi:hypothetical protein